MLFTARRLFAVICGAVAFSLAGRDVAFASEAAAPTGAANLFYMLWWLVGVGGASLAATAREVEGER